MPMISGGYKVLAHYPDGSEKLLTLYAEPVEGHTIAHGWVVWAVTQHENGGFAWEISVKRPPLAEAG
ncbi:MAG TPA: hypothetical protein VJ689_11585 [Gaiellaceae bacterium]|nr:hypothetical protein [Gaiellaceae bacterium]